MPKPIKSSAGFTLFATAWAISGLFHQLSFDGWRWNDPKGMMLSAAILWFLYNPSSWQRFAVLLIIDCVSVAWTFPQHPNHIVFSWVVNGTLLASLLAVVRQERTSADLASRWYCSFAPWVRIELCVLYFFTVFHKLNVSYFDLHWSCSAKLHREISAWVPFLPGAQWAQSLGIYGTLIIETAIPVLLFFGRTRVAGVILGMLFHGLLALHPHPGLFSFSSTMTALFTTFIPLAMASSMRPTERIQKIWKLVLSVAIVAVACLYLLWNFRNGLPSWLNLEGKLGLITRVGFILYYVYLVVGLYLVIRSVRVNRREAQGRFEGRWIAYPLLLAFPLLLIANGFGPYLGLRTQTSFSMFSNLHTENGMTNHLIVPSGIQLTDWQLDLVEIIDSGNAGLISVRDSNLLLVYLELRRRRTSGDSDFWVKFRRKGQIEVFDAKKPETHHVLPPLGIIARRYFFFRPVERDPLNVRCKH